MKKSTIEVRIRKNHNTMPTICSACNRERNVMWDLEMRPREGGSVLDHLSRSYRRICCNCVETEDELLNVLCDYFDRVVVLNNNLSPRKTFRKTDLVVENP